MKIILAAGASGGHLFPAIRVAEELRKSGHEVVFVGSFGLRVEEIIKRGFQHEEIKTRGIDANLFKALGAVFLLLKTSGACYKLFKKIEPNVVVGFGGHSSFPAVLAAVLLRYPTMIHEQNVIPGRANVLLAKFVKRIAISFDKTKKYFKAKKTVLTGCPSHLYPNEKSISALLKVFGLHDDKVTIFVFGGSQGSHRINEIFLKTAQQLKGKLDFQVIHVSGPDDQGELHDGYGKLGIPFMLFDFLSEMDQAYAVSDLVISRAGAVTVTELAMFQKPAILIPYPFAQAHQRENGLILAEANMATIIDEKDLSVSTLTNSILTMTQSKLNFNEIQKFLQENFISDSSKRLAAEVINLV